MSSQFRLLRVSKSFPNNNIRKRLFCSVNLGLEQISGIISNPNKVGIRVNDKQYTYKQLLNYSNNLAQNIREKTLKCENKHVAFIIPPGFEYTGTKLAIWLAGGVSIPLSPEYPALELQYTIENSNSDLVILDNKSFELLKD
eukprot:UN05298